MSEEIAILHDRFPQIGGGERFAIEAARALDAPIYTTYMARGTEVPDDVDVIPFRQAKYTRGPIRSRLLEWKNEGMNPLETLNVAVDMTDAADELENFDKVLLSAPLSKGYVPHRVDQEIYHYPHSPPRWLFDLYRDRLDSFDYPIVGWVLRSYAQVWRSWDKTRGTSIDHYIANSELVRDRINRFYGEEASVVYPPVAGDWYSGEDEGYFVTWSRLAPEKRIPMICEAFAGLDERLVVAGDGEQRETIEGYAQENENIECRGYVENIEDLVAHSRAVVYAPQDEDFGLVGAEAQMAGRPLLGVNEGYTKTQVETGHGELFEPTVASIREVVRGFDHTEYDHGQIRADAQRYDRDQFATRLRQIVLGDEAESITESETAYENRRRHSDASVA